MLVWFAKSPTSSDTVEICPVCSLRLIICSAISRTFSLRFSIPSIVWATVWAPFSARESASLALFAEASAFSADCLEEAPSWSTVAVVWLTESACSVILVS